MTSISRDAIDSQPANDVRAWARHLAWLLSWRVSPVPILAACVLLMVGQLALFTPREVGMEEAGLHNAVYTWATTGRMSFPIYGLFDSFGIHPHTYYFLLGVIMRAGADLYLAEAI